MPGPAQCCRLERATVKMATAPRFVIARALRARGNLGKAVTFSPGLPVIHPGTARLPRRFSPRNGNSDSLAPPNHHCNTRNCRRRSLSAATDAIGWYVLIGSLQTASAFPRLPRPLWGLAMTHQGSAKCTSPAMTRQTNRPLKDVPDAVFSAGAYFPYQLFGSLGQSGPSLP